MSLKYLLSSDYIMINHHILIEYFLIFIFLILSLIISIIVFSLSYFLSYKSLEKEKLSAYECGFNPFEDARNQFDIRFYLVSILFIIFDLEVSFLFP
jgi:NADH:ubiquinone oxidoreductase subunit 3 (subunit A)